MKKIYLSLLLALGLAAGSLQASTPHEEARKQIGVTTKYDPAYVVIPYPNGDVPKERGVCTDVVIRALRGIGLDLQKAVHEDMKANFSKYPTIWGLKRPDKNIDHRRVPNLRRYFERQGWSLKVEMKLNNFKPGDLVTCTLNGSLPHIMIISDKKTSRGIPLVIHNVGRGTVEENFLFHSPLNGHYRINLKKKGNKKASK